MQEKEHGGKNIWIMLAIIVAIGVAGYFYITRSKTTLEDPLLTVSSNSKTAPIDGNLLKTLLELKKHPLNDSIFKNPIWLSLIDFSKPIEPQPVFRANPFAPLGSVSQASTTAR